MQMEYDENMFPKYLMGEAMSIGETMTLPACRLWSWPSKAWLDRYRLR